MHACIQDIITLYHTLLMECIEKSSDNAIQGLFSAIFFFFCMKCRTLCLCFWKHFRNLVLMSFNILLIDMNPYLSIGFFSFQYRENFEWVKTVEVRINVMFRKNLPTFNFFLYYQFVNTSPSLHPFMIYFSTSNTMKCMSVGCWMIKIVPTLS